ncbi:MAG: hypothetical protein HYY64_00745 [Candidatus Rokubacteria bacterium]|nr:hypothetical protein [Candidatus Rokubacteria bacterium]
MAWWEVRRIPFNLIVGVYGVVCLVAFFWAITTSGHLQPGEDAVEPLALLAAPFGINVLYTTRVGPRSPDSARGLQPRLLLASAEVPKLERRGKNGAF